MTATEHFKKYVSDLLEQMFVMKADLEQAQARIAELEKRQADEGVNSEHGATRQPA